MNKRILSISLGLSVLLSLGSAFPVFAQTGNASPLKEKYTVEGSVTQTSEDLIKSYDGEHRSPNAKDPILSNVKYFIVNGKKQNNGKYQYNFSLSKGPENPNTIVATELAFNEKAHTQLIKVGESTTPPDKISAKDSSSISVTPTEKAPLSSSATIDPTHSFTTTWYDPASLIVNQVQDTISYSYNGTSITSYSGSDYRYWLSDSGWYEALHGLYSTNASDWTSAWVNTVEEYENDIFAGVITGTYDPTYVWYEPNQVKAFGNGSFTGSVSTWDSGGLASWLWYNNYLQ